MTERTIEAEADSLDEAREQVKSQLPEGFVIVSEEVLSHGETERTTGTGDSMEAAFEQAESRLPPNVEVIKKSKQTAPAQKVVVVKAFDEERARAQVERRIGKTAKIGSIRLKKPGSKGFLGLGKKPNWYEIGVSAQAVVEIEYRSKPRIRVEIAESPESWAQRLKEKKDYRALAAINNSKDYDEPFHWAKRDTANSILMEVGAEAVDAIIEELATDGVGSSGLAELLVKIGDPKAVPLLKRKFDRGDFAAYGIQQGVERFIQRHQDLVGEVEMVECAICGKTRPVTETHGAAGSYFCFETCWTKRGRMLGSEDGAGCPYYNEDRMCVPPEGEPTPCSFTFAVGPSYTDCVVYHIHLSR